MSWIELSIHRSSQAQQAVEMLKMKASSARRLLLLPVTTNKSFLFAGAYWSLCLHLAPNPAKLCISLIITEMLINYIQDTI